MSRVEELRKQLAEAEAEEAARVKAEQEANAKHDTAPEPWLSAKEICEHYRWRRDYLYKMLKRAETDPSAAPPFKRPTGTVYYFRLSDVERWIEASSTKRRLGKPKSKAKR